MADSYRVGDFEIRNPYGIKVIKEVEQGFRAKIELIRSEVKREYVGVHGEARVENGRPIVVVAEKAPLSELLVVHEAEHLRMILQGFPTVTLELGGGPAYQYAGRLEGFTLAQIANAILTELQHKKFNQNLRDAGYDVGHEVKEDFMKLITGEKDFRNEDVKRPISVAINMLMVKIETEDELLLSNYQDFVRNRLGPEGIELGHRLLEKLAERSIDSPSEFEHAFVELYNVAIAGAGYRFSAYVAGRSPAKNNPDSTDRIILKFR